MNIPFNVKTARKQIKVWTNVAKDLKTLRLWTSWDFLVHLTLGQRCGRCNIYWDGTTHQVSSGEECSWVSRKAQQSLILHVWKMGSSLIQVWLFFWLDSQALREIVALPTQKINFFTCLWSFISRTVTLWIKVGIVDVKDNFHLTTEICGAQSKCLRQS